MQLKKTKGQNFKLSLSDSRPVSLITMPRAPVTPVWHCHLTNEYHLEDISLEFLVHLSDTNLHGLIVDFHAFIPLLTLFPLWGFLLKGLDTLYTDKYFH